MISIKLSMNGIVRRAALNEDRMYYNYQEIEKVARRLYPELSNQGSFSFSWTDDEGDNILLSSEEEFREAVRVMLTPQNLNNNKCLRFVVIPNNTKDDSEGNFSTSKGQEACAHSASCDECLAYPIIGIRYKCTTREDFDLCTNCEAKRSQPFPMVKIYDASQRWIKDNSRGHLNSFHCKHIPKAFHNANNASKGGKFGCNESFADVLPEIISVVMSHIADSAEPRKEESEPPTGIHPQEMAENILKTFAAASAGRCEGSVPSSENLENCIAESINSIISSLFSTSHEEGSREGRTPATSASTNPTTTSNTPNATGTGTTGSMGASGGHPSRTTDHPDFDTSNCTSSASAFPPAGTGLTDSDIWQSELQMLAEMGFFDSEAIIPLLRRFAHPPLSQRRQQLQDSYGSPDAALINMNGIHRVVNELFSR